MTEIQGKIARTGQGPVRELDRPIVALRFGGRRVGLYRVRQVGAVGMLLTHGGISFPVGTRLDVEAVRPGHSNSFLPPLPATVVDNTESGFRLVWCRRESHGEGQ